MFLIIIMCNKYDFQKYELKIKTKIKMVFIFHFTQNIRSIAHI